MTVAHIGSAHSLSLAAIGELAETVRGAARRAAGLAGGLLHEARRIARVTRIERAIRMDEDNVVLWRELAEYHEAERRCADAVRCYRRLISIYSRVADVDAAACCYRRIERLGGAEPARIYRDLAALYAGALRFEEAARACTRVVEIYLAEGQRGAAAGYARGLPALGPLSSCLRAELERLVGRSLERPRVGATDRSYCTAHLGAGPWARGDEQTAKRPAPADSPAESSRGRRTSQFVLSTD